MGKNKLKKFQEMQHFHNVLQYPYSLLKNDNFKIKGNWNKVVFKNNFPIVLELGCGKGEYTLELSKIFPNKNFIGIDIKGARMYSGAKRALNEGLFNVVFIRTNIEFINYFFSEYEVSEIWITFPDPQIKKKNKRLTSIRFIEYYRHVLIKGGIIHLKTDSYFLWDYTIEVLKANDIHILLKTEDVYNDYPMNRILSIQTFYEKQWIKKGLKIKYLSFLLKGKI